MLFDVVFFGLPLVLAVCLGVHAVREQSAEFWRPCCSFIAYCGFYLVGGREVLLYLVCGVIMGGAWASVGLGPGS
jgi:hypothetical protein